jgi:hypothetical protein
MNTSRFESISKSAVEVAPTKLLEYAAATTFGLAPKFVSLAP